MRGNFIFFRKNIKLHSNRLNTDRQYTCQLSNYYLAATVLDLILHTNRLSKSLRRLIGLRRAGNAWKDYTSVFLVFRRFQQVDKFDVDVKLHRNDQCDLQQDQLQLLNTCQTKIDAWQILQMLWGQNNLSLRFFVMSDKKKKVSVVQKADAYWCGQ